MKPVIIGAGLAGLTVALHLAPQPVIVLSATKLGEGSSSAWAQGGIAAAIGNDDAASLHAADTIKVGGGLCDAAIVQQVTNAGHAVIERLLQQGTQFDRDTAGALVLGLEAAHSRRRIVHAGDATGAVVMRALIAAVRATPSITVMENTVALDLATGDGICGVTINHKCKTGFIATDKIVLATGGAGALWQHTTNPLTSVGQGLALAARAGAVLGDLEFMQFHPTAIDIGRDPMPLASEALRGEGAVLVDEKGAQFVDSLQPRDVVARAIWARSAAGHQVFLDARPFAPNIFTQHFPHIYKVCLQAGIDPTRQPIPIRPAAHYHMGGVMTDAKGRTNIKGLWACGEVANTGLHGANRLASNSLLEAAAFGKLVAEDILGSSPQPSVSKNPEFKVQNLSEDKSFIRSTMSRSVGMLRDQAGLTAAIAALTPLAPKSDMALVGLMIATAALRRCESRGAHTRTDYPAALATAQRSALSLTDLFPEGVRHDTVTAA